MKIAGLTWWRNNYGSVLQAYALQEILRNDYNIDYEILCQFEKNSGSIKNIVRSLKNIGLKKTINKLIWKFSFSKIRERNRAIQNFINNKLIISKANYNINTIESANDVYDGFICGSDQIWNPNLPGATSIYRLTFAQKDKLKIAYAPSIGVTEMSSELKEKYKADLSSFNALSCREEQGTRFLNSFLEKPNCQTVLDPTLLIDRKVWDQLSEFRICNEKYVFAYILRGTKKQRKIIEDYAKKNGLKLVTIPFLDSEKIEMYDFTFGDIKVWKASPIDFISLIRHSEVVFTDSFHCMVFSCLYHKLFYGFQKIGKSQNTRLYELQKMFHINNRIITSDTSLESIPNSIDWNLVDKILTNMKETSKKYLNNALTK